MADVSFGGQIVQAARRRRRIEVRPDAFSAFYDRAFDEVFHYLWRAVLGDRALAEDLTQETFAALVAPVRDGRAEVESMAWVIGVARHKLIDHYRRVDSEQRRLALAWARRNVADDDADLDGEDPARIVELLRGLSAMHRLVLILRYVDDLSVDEIGALVGRSVSATESLLVRARQALVASHRDNES
jgi:RNA polymerase sigma-70 factor, ECF subfamily